MKTKFCFIKYILSIVLLIFTFVIIAQNQSRKIRSFSPVDSDNVLLPIVPVEGITSNYGIFWKLTGFIEQGMNGDKYEFYRLLLSSNMRNFSLFVPSNNAFNKYIDPVAYGQDNVQGVLKFWINNSTSMINATVYRYDAITGIVGDSVDVISDQNFIKNRLTDFLNYHFFVGNIQSNKRFYITYGNDVVGIEGESSLQIKGGGDFNKNTSVSVENTFNKSNGTTYFVNNPIEPTLKSVYKVLSETPEFNEFFKLIRDIPSSIEGLSDINGNNMMDSVQILLKQGIDYRIRFFSAFNYTVYVPTNDAIVNAIADGTIIPWSTILSMTDKDQKWQAIKNIIRLISYHFQDYAVFADQEANGRFSTAALKVNSTPTHFGTARTKFFKILVEGTATATKLTMDTNLGAASRTAYIDKSKGLYNIIAKDYVFNKIPSAFKNVDGSGSASSALFNTSSIISSSCAVIHQIDHVLLVD